jgi:hypothetical protein
MFIFKPKYARIEDQKPGGEQPQEQAKEEAPMTSPDR